MNDVVHYEQMEHGRTVTANACFQQINGMNNARAEIKSLRWDVSFTPSRLMILFHFIQSLVHFIREQNLQRQRSRHKFFLIFSGNILPRNFFDVLTMFSTDATLQDYRASVTISMANIQMNTALEFHKFRSLNLGITTLHPRVRITPIPPVL